MRIIIPAAGIGKRLQPHTFVEPKVMMRLAGKPMIGHIMDLVMKMSPREVVVVVGYKSDAIVRYLSESYSSMKIRFVVQDDMLGLGHAVYITGDSDDDTLIILGDTIFRFDFEKILKSADNSIGVAHVEDPRRFGVVEMSDDGAVRNLVEKPQNPPSNLAIVGIYRIREFHLLFEALASIVKDGKKTSGEIQLTDALQEMINRGGRITTFGIEKWLDCGKPETLFSTQAYLLKEMAWKYSVPGTAVIDPVYISDHAVIENSVIGPNVDLAENCSVTNCVVRNSIVGKNALLKNAVIEDSIIGENARIIGHFKKINAVGYSEIDL